jgi:peroxiredoxin (alkyl hydroperoxide reductase subunit C)
VKKGPDEDVSEQHQEKEMTSKEDAIMIQVGKQAPEFTAPAYHKGTFISTNLSEYLGNWVVLCFYPGDFTFV